MKLATLLFILLFILVSGATARMVVDDEWAAYLQAKEEKEQKFEAYKKAYKAHRESHGPVFGVVIKAEEVEETYEQAYEAKEQVYEAYEQAFEGLDEQAWAAYKQAEAAAGKAEEAYAQAEAYERETPWATNRAKVLAIMKPFSLGEQAFEVFEAYVQAAEAWLQADKMAEQVFEAYEQAWAAEYTAQGRKLNVSAHQRNTRCRLIAGIQIRNAVRIYLRADQARLQAMHEDYK